MSNNFQRSPEQFRSVKGGNLPVSWESTKLCMTTGLMLVDFYSQELSHVNNDSVCLCLCECLRVRVCAWMCVAGFVYACERMKVWDAGGREKWERLEWEGACSLPRVSVDVAELFMPFCDAILLAALGHRGNNRRFLNPRTRAGNDGFRNTPLPIDRSLVPLRFSGGTAGLFNVGPSREVTLAPGWLAW